MKLVAFFEEFDRPMIVALGTTNIKLMAKALRFRHHSDDWVGKQVIVYTDPNVSFGGELTGGLRVKPAKGRAACAAESPSSGQEAGSDARRRGRRHPVLMKPIPDLNNEKAMAARGRRAALWSARKAACEELRHAATTLLHDDDITDVAPHAAIAREAIDRIETVARLLAEQS
jgi:hypothetical protein